MVRPAAPTTFSKAHPSRRRMWRLVVVAALAASGGVAAWRLSSPSELPRRPDADPASAERQLVEATFPPDLPLGRRWTVEVEGDVPTLERTWKPRRVRSELSVAEVADDLVMVDARDLHFDHDHVRFVLRAPTLAVVRVQSRRQLAPSLDADVGWAPVVDDVVPACDMFLDPSHLPIVHRSTASGEVIDVLGERHIGGVRQRAWIEDGLIRFEIQQTARPGTFLTVVWRPGDPWWAKYECFVQGKTDNPLPPRRDGSFSRTARARLVAVDGVPIEPLAWEHPPADWMAERSDP